MVQPPSAALCKDNSSAQKKSESVQVIALKMAHNSLHPSLIAILGVTGQQTAQGPNLQGRTGGQGHRYFNFGAPCSLPEDTLLKVHCKKPEKGSRSHGLPVSHTDL